MTCEKCERLKKELEMEKTWNKWKRITIKEMDFVSCEIAKRELDLPEGKVEVKG